jgi:hypothetical protein
MKKIMGKEWGSKSRDGVGGRNGGKRKRIKG